ncbi:MAG: class I SAM-dependent methyltransferase [Patescibacteria group bacterium]|nr:class I SAM-dependent methyltransferase [Patescibacteria group bacterium]MDE2015864.1 class I SAM-dependent methyltransferase [Patescibacteria group bacterium]MDE2227353.1 class I SAM-dependent methyltransferase [Patescibacteria group bacterium]
MNTEFTQDWFSQNIPIWQAIIGPKKGNAINALEIGCFEGRATCWLLDNVLTSPESHITCVDTFHSDEELKDIDFGKVKERFIHNTSPYGGKVSLVVDTSENYLRHTAQQFSLIYIDGSHMAPDVLTDAVLAHRTLEKGGIMVFDDYLWTGLGKLVRSPKMGIDAFLDCFGHLYTPLSIGYQVIICKK